MWVCMSVGVGQHGACMWCRGDAAGDSSWSHPAPAPYLPYPSHQAR